MMSRKFSEKQIQILKEYYPKGDWDMIFKYFPNQKKHRFSKKFFSIIVITKSNNMSE